MLNYKSEEAALTKSAEVHTQQMNVANPPTSKMNIPSSGPLIAVRQKKMNQVHPHFTQLSGFRIRLAHLKIRIHPCSQPQHMQSHQAALSYATKSVYIVSKPSVSPTQKQNAASMYRRHFVNCRRSYYSSS